MTIVDIIKSSLVKYDYGTLETGLEAIEERIGIISEKEYLFSWDDIPGNDNVKFINFLNTNFGIYWVKTAKIGKIDGGKTISVYVEDKILSLKLNDEKTKINLKIDGNRNYEFIAETENGKLNIYESLNTNEDLKISEYVFGHLVPVGKLALSRSDEISIKQVTNTIQEIGSIAAKNRCEWVTDEAFNILKTIGIDAAERKLERPITSVIKAIQKIAEISVDAKFKIHGIEAGLSGASCLKEIGMAAIDNNLERHAHIVASSLELVGINAKTAKQYKIRCDVVTALKALAYNSSDNCLPELTQKIRNSLNSVVNSIPSECMCEICKAYKALYEVIALENT